MQGSHFKKYHTSIHGQEGDVHNDGPFNVAAMELEGSDFSGYVGRL